MRKEIVIGALTIGGALLVYCFNFNEWHGLSEEKGDWGTFGDFVGGLSNPIITFITMCMLIKSIDLQKDANNSIIEQNNRIKNSEVKQGELEDLRSFESTFYRLAEVARQEYSRLRIKDLNGEEYREAYAVSYIEEGIIRRHQANIEEGTHSEFSKMFDMLDAQSSMGIFSSIRSFYILFKITIEVCPVRHQEKYLEICNYTMPVRFLNLVCIAQAYSGWEILKLIEDRGFFKKEGLEDYLAAWNNLKSDFDHLTE